LKRPKGLLRYGFWRFEGGFGPLNTVFTSEFRFLDQELYKFSKKVIVIDGLDDYYDEFGYEGWRLPKLNFELKVLKMVSTGLVNRAE